MRFEIQIDCDNAAFGDNDWERGEEIARILNEIGKQAKAGFVRGFAYDTNGNRVGTYTTTQEQ